MIEVFPIRRGDGKRIVLRPRGTTSGAALRIQLLAQYLQEKREVFLVDIAILDPRDPLPRVFLVQIDAIERVLAQQCNGAVRERPSG